MFSLYLVLVAIETQRIIMPPNLDAAMAISTTFAECDATGESMAAQVEAANAGVVVVKHFCVKFEGAPL